MTVARRKLSPLGDRLYSNSSNENNNEDNKQQKKKSKSKKKSHLCRLILLVIAFFQAFLLLLASQVVEDQLHKSGDSLFASSSSSEAASTRTRSTRSSSSDTQQRKQPPLDNYYARSHIPKNEAVPLVVGGSDGSGTRAVADVLQQLGVPMVYDDPQTLDVHATQLFHGKGWPPLAELVLPLSNTNFTTTVLDDASSLPSKQQVRRRTKLELNRLKKDMEHRGATLRRAAVRESPLDEPSSSAVSYGFKAPITMLLLPLIQAYMYPSPNNKFKFLHVLRDGRDVALSDNQSPTQKFYKMTYPNAKQDRLTKFWNVAPVFGMQLWNDWNVHVLEWEQAQQAHAQAQAQQDDTTTQFDYLVLRTEDLIHDRFETLKNLADFVGSTKTLQELCCLTNSRDLGESNTDLRTTYRRQLRAKKKALLQSRKERHSNTTTKTAVQEEQDDQEERENHRRLSDSPMVRNPRRAKRHILDSAPTTTTTTTWYQRWSSNMGMMWYYPWFFFFGFGDFASLVKMQLKALKRKQHSTTTSISTTSVEERYGKWESLLASNLLLSQALHEEGAEALELFGYNPPRQFSDAPLDDGDFVCDATVKCPSEDKD